MQRGSKVGLVALPDEYCTSVYGNKKAEAVTFRGDYPTTLHDKKGFQFKTLPLQMLDMCLVSVCSASLRRQQMDGFWKEQTRITP